MDPGRSPRRVGVNATRHVEGSMNGGFMEKGDELGLVLSLKDMEGPGPSTELSGTKRLGRVQKTFIRETI